MFLTLYGEKFLPLNRAYHSYSQKIPAQLAGTCPWHSDLRRGKGHSQPPDYRTYSAEVTGYAAISRIIAVLARASYLGTPSASFIIILDTSQNVNTFFSVFYKKIKVF